MNSQHFGYYHPQYSFFFNFYTLDPASRKPDINFKHLDHDYEVLTHDTATSCNANNDEESKDIVNILPTHNTSCGRYESRTGAVISPITSSPAKIPLSVCETHGLHENILAAHHRGTMVVGSIDTWAEANASEALMSSTPADVLLAESVKPSFGGDGIEPFTDLGNSTDSGLHMHAKYPVCAHQVILCSLTLNQT
jgi:hypothetical protein